MGSNLHATVRYCQPVRAGCLADGDQADWKPALLSLVTQSMQHVGLFLMHAPARTVDRPLVENLRSQLAYTNKLTFGQIMAWESKLERENGRGGAIPFGQLKHLSEVFPGFEDWPYPQNLYTTYRILSLAGSLSEAKLEMKRTERQPAIQSTPT